MGDAVEPVEAAQRLTDGALQRLTRRRLGLSPQWLIQRRRLQEAAVRLAPGRDGAGELAAQLGYADQAHFTRDFSKIIGMTPSAYQRLNNG